MRRLLQALAFTCLAAIPAVAQPMPGGPLTDGQAARMQCRQEAASRGIVGPERRLAVRQCMQTRFPQLAGNPELRAERQNCRQDARARGARGPEVRAAVLACLQARRPDLARIVQCRQTVRAQGLMPRTPEFRAAVQSCRRGG